MKELLLALNGIILTSTFATVAWIATKVWEMNPKVVNTEVRVERIVDVLPEVKVRIAQEDVSRRIPVAVVTTEPEQESTGQWTKVVHLVNFSSGKRFSYKVPLKGPNDPFARYLINGMAQESGRQRISFHEMAQSSEELGFVYPVPGYVDSSSSWIFFKEKNDLLHKMRSHFDVVFSERSTPTGDVKWKQLINELSMNELKYKTLP